MAYKKTNEGSATVFTVEPEPVPSSTRTLLIVLFIAGVPFVLGVMLLNFIAGLVAIALIWGAAKVLGALMSAAPASTAYRTQSTFRVTPEAIVKDGLTISVKDIHRLILRNHISTAMAGMETVIVSNSTYGAANYNTGRSVGMARNRAMEQISNRVDVESGGRATTLAGGLTDAAAFGLAKDIQAITGVELYR